MERQQALRLRAISANGGVVVLWFALGAAFVGLAIAGGLRGNQILLAWIAATCFFATGGISLHQLRTRLKSPASGAKWSDFWQEVRKELRSAYPWLNDEAAPERSVRVSQKAGQDWSTVHLRGVGEGRFWELAFLPTGLEGEYGFNFAASFRAAPLGEESIRPLPFLYMIARPPLVPPTPVEARALSLDRILRGRTGPSLSLKPEGPPLVVGASYPDAEQDLSSDRWKSLYLEWCRAGTQLSAWKRHWPSLVGVVPTLNLNVAVRSSTTPAECVSLFRRFMDQADEIEEMFDAPRPTLTPLELGKILRKNPADPPGVTPLYRCPVCGLLSKVSEGEIKDGVCTNLLTFCHKAPVFRPFPRAR